MGPIKVVDVYGDILEVDRAWLEEEIRKGHLSPHTGVCHEPWTGDAFVAAGELPALAEVWREPNAAFTRHIFRTRMAWLALSVAVFVFVVGILQFLGFLPELLGATGLEPIVFDAQWWSPFGSQLVHGGPDHLLMNLAVLGYCGYRVERALGASGTLAVICAGVLGGALAVTLFEDLPVIGSSIVGYAVWGAQIAIGFRFGDSIPPHFRKFYGYGNLLAFAVLWVGSLSTDGISHWGHAGGLFGGVAVAMSVRTAPQHGPRSSLLVAAITSLVAIAIGPVLRLLPTLSLGAADRIEMPEAGVSMELPARLRPSDPERVYDYTILSEPAWKTGSQSDEALYCGVWKMPESAFESGDLLLGQDFVDYVNSDYGLDAVQLPDPEPLMPGWTGTAVEFVDARDGRTYRIEEHHLVRGRWLTRLGFIVDVDGPGHRRALFEDVIRSAEELELPEVADARREYERNPKGRLIRLNYANALAMSGELDGADALYAELIQDLDSNHGWDALWNRLWYWGHVPAHFPVEGSPWFADPVDAYPDDRTMQYSAVAWYAEHGRCSEAFALQGRFFERRPQLTETLRRMDEALDQSECGVGGGEPGDRDAER